MEKSYLFLAEGFEEIEALTVVDVMRRAGMELVTVSVTSNKVVKGAHSIPVTADATVDEIDAYDAEWLIVPGGMPGATNVAACGKVNDMLKKQQEKGGNIAAICAAPAVVLAPLGILRGENATCYPSFEPALEKGGATHIDQRVVVSNNIITSNGPSSALPFALAIVAASLGDDVATSVASGMLLV
jgi:4-methyl-5(b-hydroxyethyl)-thiazole monophosphate biosynthesis